MLKHTASELVDTYYHSLPNLNQPHEKQAIFFIGCSGSGKSTIAQAIVENLRTTYLCNDDARQLLHTYSLDVSAHQIITDTWDKIEAEARNRCIVFDCSIGNSLSHPENYYDRARSKGYRHFIITIDVPHTALIARIEKRGRYDTKTVLELLPDQLVAQEQAKRTVKTDYTIATDVNLPDLLSTLRQFIR